jgi:hypothetical protein
LTLSLEYIICQHTEAGRSHAVKSHVSKNQNPGVTVLVSRDQVTWELLGLSLGEVEDAIAREAAKTRLDFYVGKAELLRQRAHFPIVNAGHGVPGLKLTNPTGTVRKGGKSISWKGPIAKFPAVSAQMTFPTGPFECITADEVLFNIDWEPAMYPLGDGTRTQIHFGVEAAWQVRPDRRLKTPRAKVVMTAQQYADVLSLLGQIAERP